MKVKKLKLCCNHDYFTETAHCSCDRSTVPYKVFYCIDGTAYGRLRKSNGDIRLFKSYSGAYKAMKKL
jgi:hypothetical protein